MGEQAEIYNRIDKVLWDKQMEMEKKRMNCNSLEYQIHQKKLLKSIEEIEREKERNDRLKQLSQLREDQMRERLENVTRANKYYEELNVQAALQKQIHEIEELQYRAPIPRPKENPPPPIYSEGQSPVFPLNKQSLQFTPEKHFPTNLFKFTKKSPKTIIFNPITGELKDTRFVEQRSFSHFKARKLSPDLKQVYPRTEDDRNRSYFQEAGNSIIKARQSPLS